MFRERVQSYLNLLWTVLEENELFGKSGSVFNMDETGLQLNNHSSHDPGLFQSVTSAEKGETVTLVACCNAEGNFVPPVCIMKGKNKKKEYEDGMPPGSFVYMS
ncbi:hypothetical protein NQ318_017151 [Aromia moschata]|uniref:DDE-1 domain-containing protein n=1 Tax=Aromia moschata TaxID=1265417 RepID=A0AAV8Y0P1_9CUCU|nr:hypothetical protein NQ318_017151 [Aromia moschata]